MKVQSVLSELWWLSNADELQAKQPVPLQVALQKVMQTFNFF